MQPKKEKTKRHEHRPQAKDRFQRQAKALRMNLLRRKKQQQGLTKIRNNDEGKAVRCAY